MIMFVVPLLCDVTHTRCQLIEQMICTYVDINCVAVCSVQLCYSLFLNDSALLLMFVLYW